MGGLTHATTDARPHFSVEDGATDGDQAGTLRGHYDGVPGVFRCGGTGPCTVSKADEE